MDLDGDGRKDILSGSWPGEIYLFRGEPGGGFADGVTLKDRDGKPINVGGIKGKLANGEEFTSGTAAAVHAADWDGDGDLDLVVGNIAGSVFLIPNEGTNRAYAFGPARKLEADGKPIEVPHGDAGPFVADWDGDGDPDLLVGTGAGSVLWFRNTGSPQRPELGAARTLVPESGEGNGPASPDRPGRGTRAKVCAADWNADGRLDLLVGDFVFERSKPPDRTEAEKAADAKAREALEDLSREMADQAKPPKDETPEAKAEREAKIRSLRERMQEVAKAIPQDYAYHGRVWIYLRRSSPEDAAGP